MAEEATPKRIRNRKNTKNGYLILTIVISFIAGLITYQGIVWITTALETVTVPAAITLTNQQQEKDGTACKHFSTVPENNCKISFQESDTTPRGQIITQTPASGNTIKAPLEAITLVYSSGPSSAKLPSLEGLTVNEAVKTIYEKGLNVGTVTQLPSYTTPETVLSNTNADETLKNGTNIGLTVSIEGITVPNLVGKTLTEAKIVSEKLGLIAETVGDENSKVITQFPTPSIVAKDSKILLTGTITAENENTTVPQIIGKNLKETNKLLVDAGFTKITVVEVKNNDVNSQQTTQVIPKEGAKVSKQSEIVVIYSSPL